MGRCRWVRVLLVRRHPLSTTRYLLCLRRAALRWVRGELSVRHGLRQFAGVRTRPLRGRNPRLLRRKQHQTA